MRDCRVASAGYMITGAVVLLFLGCTAAPTPSPSDESTIIIEGELTQISIDDSGGEGEIARLLVEEDPSLSIEDYHADPLGAGTKKFIVGLYPGTVIRIQSSSGSPAVASVGDLTVGMRVKAVNMPFIVDTGIPRVNALEVTAFPQQ